MNDRCLVCGGSIGMLGDCIECGTCAICYPWQCTCVYQEVDPEDWEDPEDWDDEPEDWKLWGFPETGYIGPIPNCFT